MMSLTPRRTGNSRTNNRGERRLRFVVRRCPGAFGATRVSSLRLALERNRHPKSGAAAPHYKTLARLRARYPFPASHSLSGMA